MERGQIITNIDEIKHLDKELKDTFFGVFYALEYGDYIKIGQSAQPYNRLTALIRNAKKYGQIKTGNVYISQLHTNYRENEKVLHQFFNEYRINDSELFNITLDEFVSKLNNANLQYSSDYDNDTSFLEWGKNLLSGNFNHIIGGKPVGSGKAKVAKMILDASDEELPYILKKYGLEK